MQNLLDRCIAKFSHERAARQKLACITLALAFVVTVGVYWQLKLTGAALANEYSCGMEEHTHSDECYELVLICGLEEDEELSQTDDTAAGHTHTEDCYEEQSVLVCELEEGEGHTHSEECYETQQVLVCGLEEGETEPTEDNGGHVHTEDCYEKRLICELTERTHTAECLIDETADVETADDWKKTLPELTGVWADDVVSIANSQIGYVESTANYTLDEDGETHKGYTRYGAWAGNPYGDWDAMFVSFCLHYAGLSTEDFPEATGAYAWSVKLQESELYADAADYTPVPGDLVFFDADEDGKIDRVGIVDEIDAEKKTLSVIEGNYEDAVCKIEYDLVDASSEKERQADGSQDTEEQSEPTIIGYGILPEQDTTEPASEEEVETDGTLSYDGGDFTVTVSYGTDAELPENVELAVSEYNVESETYQARYAEAAELYGWEESSEPDFRLFSIELCADGEAIEPAAEVTVTISYMEDVEETEYTVTHYGEDGTTTIDSASSYEDGTQTIHFGTDGFSDYGISVASEESSAVIAVLTSSDVTAVDSMYVWIFDKAGTKVAGYVDNYNNGNNGTPVLDALQYTDADGATWYLIPITYFETELASYGFSFDTSECPFQYAPSAYSPAGNLTDAYYVSVDGSYYIRVADTTGLTPHRTNIYYTKDYVRTYSTVEGISPSGTVINLFDYWTTGQYDADAATSYNSDTGINENHALKFSCNPKQWDVTKNTAYNYFTGSAAVYTDIVQNLLSDSYPILNSSTTGSSESLAYLFDPTVSTDGKASYSKVTGLLQIDSNGYYYYNSSENYAEYDEDTNSFTLYDDWAVYSSANNGQFFPFDSLDSLGDDPQTKSCDDEDMNHYFGLTLTTRFSQQYDGYTSSSKTTATTFEFSGDDDVWIFIDGVLVADLGGIHSAASVVIDFSTGNVTINGTVTNTLKSAYEAAGMADSYTWNGNTYENNSYHTLKFYYLERGNSASNLSLKCNLTVIPETGIYKVNQYDEPIEGAEFAVYQAYVDGDGNYYYLYDGGGTELATSVTAKLEAGTYSLDNNSNICDSSGTVIISARYTGTTDENGEMVFLDEYSMPYSLTELESMFGTYFILKETKVPDGYRLVSEDVYLQVVNHQVLVCNNTYDSGVYASTNLLVTATDILYNASTYEEIDYYDATSGKVTGTLFAVVLKYTGESYEEGVTDGAAYWAPVYGSDASGYTVMDSYSIANVITAAQQMESNGYSDSVFTMSGSGSMQVSLTALPGAIRTYYYLAEDKSGTQYTVAYYYTTADSLSDATSDNTVRVVSDEGTITTNAGAEISYSGFYRTFGATIQVPNLSNVLLVQKLDEDGNLVNGARFAMYEVEEVEENGEPVIYYVGYTASGTKALIYLYPDEDGDNQGDARLQGDTEATGAYVIDSTEDASTEGLITVTIGSDTYSIYPTEVETTMAEGNQYSSATGMAYDTSEDGTAVFDYLTGGTYYVREISVPDGFTLNTTEIMVLVTGDTIYANAGTADDGVTVARAAGYIVATLDQMAAVGDIDNTLSWIYTTLHINTDQSDTFSFTTYASDSSYWSTLTNASDVTQHAYLTYDEGHINALFDYVVNEVRSAATGYTGTRRLYTDEGWSYLEIFQDTDYHYQRVASGASTSYAYTELDEAITNLFSRSVYIQVTDAKTEVSFVKVNGETVELDQDDDLISADTISGVEFTAYPVNESGEIITGGTTYTAVSDTDGVVTFSGLSAGTTYWIEETAAVDESYLAATWHWLVTVGAYGQITSFTAVKDDTTSSTTPIYSSAAADEPDVYSVVTSGTETTYTTYYWPNYKIYYTMPSTGGSGTQIYALIGVLLCGAAVFMYCQRKRAS